MSSAILYLAIIAIWAGVLIPRWLRRDTSRTACAREELLAEPAVAAGSMTPDDVDEADEGDEDTGHAARRRDEPGPAPASRQDSRRRVLAARRRLLWMMLGLQAAGTTLVATGLAAWWVIAPPTVMLGGYLLLLREAAAADSERDAAERDAAERAAPEAREAARMRALARARRAREREQAQQAAAPAVYAAAPVAGDYEDLGRARDFTPGLRYASAPDSAAATPADDDGAYDQYTENRLRAVGD